MNREKKLETILTITVGLSVFYLMYDIRLLLNLKWKGIKIFVDMFYLLSDIRLLLIMSVVIGMIGLFSNYLSDKIVWVWWKLIKILASVNSKILLSIIFFVFLTPVAFLARMFNKNYLGIKKWNNKSYYNERNYTYKPKDLENPW